MEIDSNPIYVMPDDDVNQIEDIFSPTPYRKRKMIYDLSNMRSAKVRLIIEAPHQRSLVMDSSIHSAGIKEIHKIPISIILRPIPSILNEDKVRSIMETIQNPLEIDNIPPIDILWIKGSEGGNYYFSFGGCHRFEAHKRLGMNEISGKLIKSTLDTLKVYLGGSAPKYLK